MKKILPEHGPCFVCGSDNSHGIGLTWYADEKCTVSSEFVLTQAQQGPPGYAHGGASAAILDEAMGAVVWLAGYNVAVVNLEINYSHPGGKLRGHPLPLGQCLSLKATLTKRTERKVYARGQICLPDGTVAVTGRGIYVEAPQLFEPVRFRERS